VTARWEEAYDALLDAYLFSVSERGQRYLDGWLNTVKADDPIALEEGGSHHRVKERLPHYLFRAEPFWVDPDMQTLWEAAIPSFQSETLREEDLPTTAGLVWLTRPYTSEDIRGNLTAARAFLWCVVEGDFLDPHNISNGAPVTGMRRGVAFALLHRVGDVDGYDDGRMQEQFPGVVRTGDLMLDWWFTWPFGVANPSQNAPRSAVRPIQCLLRLMQQTITTRESAPPSKPFRKRWAKAGMGEQREVVVVRLRRPDSRDPEAHRQVEWDHRWLVSGHWRNQWFPSSGMHRQVWISPYIKGPDDLPLVVRKARVWEFVQ
jgi:hypothetical protein